MRIFTELYKYRELLKNSVKKDVRGKYKGSVLGVLWSFISPLLMVSVYAFIFPKIMRGAPDTYYIFLATGILPWIYFTTSVSNGSFSILGNANLIKKVYFPREILPLSVVISGLISFLISCLVIVLFLIVSGIGFSVYILWFPVIVFVQSVFTLGFVLMLATFNVYIRDIKYIIDSLLLLLMYLTPILWETTMIPDRYQKYIFLNPMSGLIDAYHKVLYYKEPPYSNALLYSFVVSIVFLVLGYLVFRKLEKGFAEEM